MKRVVRQNDRMAAAKCGEALLTWLERLEQQQVYEMRGRLASRGMRAEESRQWGAPVSGRTAPRTGWVRTSSSGCFYR